MSEWTIYYNPKCGTCRKTLDLLKSRKIEPRIVEYLKTPPTAADIEAIIDAVGGDAHRIVREKEDEYAAHKLSPSSPRSAIVKAIVADPILLQRPIVLSGKRGVVARPPEEVEALF